MRHANCNTRAFAAESIARGLERHIGGNGQWKACCPAHDDHNPSLSITDNPDGGLPLVKCHAGCEQSAVIDALRAIGLWPERGSTPEPQRQRPSPASTRTKAPARTRAQLPPGAWTYLDVHGAPVMAVSRTDTGQGKRFAQWTPAPDGGWQAKSLPAPRPLYRLPELDRPGEVLILEGEKCVDAAVRAWPDRPVTTWPGGANADGKVDFTPLARRDVLLVSDTDAPGRACMKRVALRLHSLGCKVRLLLSEGEDHSDLADWLETATPDWVLELIETQSKPYTKSEPTSLSEEVLERVTFPYKDANALETVLDLLNVGCRYNLSSHRAELREADGEWEPANDRTVAKLVRTIAEQFSYHSSRGPSPLYYGRVIWADAFNAVLADRGTDPFRDWLRGLPAWDGVPRLREWVSDVFEISGTYSRVNSPALVAWASAFVFLGAVWRTFQPGTKLDEMPVLIGPQGCGKSTALRLALPQEFPELFADGLHLSSPSKERAEALQGRAIVEASEMAGANRADLESLKAFLTRTDDGVVRLAYRMNPEPLPRRAVIVGTTNDSNPLPNDPSGNRRFVPIWLSGGNVAALVRYMDKNRVQIWAEAVSAYNEDVHARLPADLKVDQVAAAERGRRRDELLEDAVSAWLVGHENGFTLPELVHGIGLVSREVPAATLPMREKHRIGNILTLQGFEKRRVRNGRNLEWEWMRPAG